MMLLIQVILLFQISLKINGGAYFKKDFYVDGDILITNVLDVLGLDLSDFGTEDYK